MYQKPIGAEEVLASRRVVDPLRLLMLCTPNEGAAAAVLSFEPARPGQVQIIGQGLRTARRSQAVGEHMPTDSPVTPDEPVTAPRRGRGLRAGRPRTRRISTWSSSRTPTREPRSSPPSSSGCARPARAGSWWSPATTRLGGRLPVNPSGGLLSKGEPVGASALGHVYEIANQLRGRCGPRQVPGARTGLTHALGAGGNCSVMVLQRA